MAEPRKKNASANQEITPPGARCAAIAAAGVTTGEDFARLMSALMSDVIEGRISPEIANASCNAGGKLLKVVEMQYRYGQNEKRAPMSLILAGR